MYVWLLVMVLLNAPNEFNPVQFLNKFDTQEECQTERNRIGFDMAASYPYERDFVIECRKWQVRGPGRRISDAPTEQLHYTEIIKTWLEIRHPQETFRIKVTVVRPILSTRGVTGVIAFQTHVYYPASSQSYILFIQGANVIGWIEAGTAPAEEEEEEMEEVFSYKDQA